MHVTDAARIATADRTAPDDRRASALWWIVPTVAFWIIVGLAVM
jgi:hypothetical protein